MEIVTQILNVIQQAPQNIEQILNFMAEHAPEETQLLIFAAVSPVMTVVIQLMGRSKFWNRFLNMDNDLTRNRIAFVGSLLMMAANYYVTDPSIAPWVVPLQAQLLHWINQPYFKLIIRPTSMKIADKWNKAKTLTQQKPTTTEFSLTPATTIQDDFSVGR